ncbi:MAG: hypothetical protein ABI761_12370 [Saprospiraceae bacterium]
MKSKSLISILITSNILLLSFAAFVCLTAFRQNNRPQNFTEINVERINVLGSTGKPVLVISNQRLMPGPTMNGKTYDRDVIDGRKYMAGMTFFNDLGDEVGGLQYAGIKKDSTGYSAVGHLSFDQWHQNQVMALDYNDHSGNKYVGMRIWDRPTNTTFDHTLDLINEIRLSEGNKPKLDSLYRLWSEAKDRGENGTERLFVGSKNEIAQIQLKDKKGNIRAKLYVDESGEAKLEFLNQQGEKIAVFPQ